MARCKIYLNDGNIHDLSKYIQDKNEIIEGTDRVSRSPESKMSAEVASIVVASITSLTTITTSILLYLSATKKSANIKYDLSSGKIIEFSSDLSSSEIKNLLKTAGDFQSAVVTIK